MQPILRGQNAEELMTRETILLIAFFIGAILLGALDYIVSVRV